MNSQDSLPSRLQILLGSLIQQTLTADEGRELNALLKADPSARLAYLRAVDQEVNLRRLIQAGQKTRKGSDAEWLSRLQAEVSDGAFEASPEPASLNDGYIGPAL